MRIAVLATSRNPLRQPWLGGQESHTGLLAQALRSRGHHVTLHARPGSDPALADEIVPYPDLPPLSVAAAADPDVPPAAMMRDHAAFTSAMSLLLRDGGVDLVHNQSLHHLPLAMSAVLDLPLVTTLHTPPLPMMEMGVALADPRNRYVGVSKTTARAWTTLPQPATVIRNGVPTGGGPPGPGGDHLLWVGRITAEKGVDIAIAVARAMGCRLRIAGPVYDPEYFESVIAPVLGPDVELLGHLSSEELVHERDHSAVSLVTSRWEEPFGLVAAESMVRGTPVVALDRGGLREVVGPRGGVLVPGQEDDGLVGRVVEGVRAALRLDRQDVADWARSTHDIELMVDRYEQLFEDVVRSR